MRWDDVLEAVVGVAQADATIRTLLQLSEIRSEVEWAEHVVPGLTFHHVSDGVSELWEPSTIQADIWMTTLEDVVTVERALRRLLDHDLPTTLETVYCYAQFTDGASLGAAMGPDRNNYFGRAARFRISPIRDALRSGRSA